MVDIKETMVRKIRSNLTSRVSKHARIEYLGCTIKELIEYLENKFCDGMAWENYGNWEIDHIKPISNFDLLDNKQKKELCHYTNLQPLWRKENLKKGGAPIKKKNKLPSKQIRVTAKQYETLGNISNTVGISKVEILSSAIGIIKLLMDNKAVSIKAVCKDGSEKELLLTLLVGLVDED